jgi:hypothetical protein
MGSGITGSRDLGRLARGKHARMLVVEESPEDLHWHGTHGQVRRSLLSTLMATSPWSGAKSPSRTSRTTYCCLSGGQLNRRLSESILTVEPKMETPADMSGPTGFPSICTRRNKINLFGLILAGRGCKEKGGIE